MDVTTTDTPLLMIALTSPDDQPPLRRNPPSDRHPPVRYCAFTNTIYSPEFSSFVSVLHSPQELESYFEAVKSPEMNEELAVLQRTHTLDLVFLPPNANPVNCKWICKIKTKSDGSVERYKARLIAWGFTQEHGIEYEETFVSVPK